MDFALTYPEMVKSLVPVDAVVGGWQFSQDWTRDFGVVVAAGRRGNIAEAKQLWLGLPLFGPARQQAPVAERLGAMVDSYSGWLFANADPDMRLQPPAAAQLGKIRVPTLIVLGGRDLPDFHGMADKLAKEIPSARKVLIPGAGHMANMEAPAEFNRIVLEFLTSVGQSPRAPPRGY